MRLTAKQFFVYYVGDERSEAQAGASIDVPADLAARLLSQGVADPAEAERAVKPRGARAVKK